MKSGRDVSARKYLTNRSIFLHLYVYLYTLTHTHTQVLRALNYKVKSPEEFDQLELETPEKIFELKAKQNTSMELTESGISFFEDLFTQFDSKGNGVLTSADIRRVFDICPSEYRTLLPVSESFSSNTLSSRRFRDDDEEEEVSSKHDENKDVRFIYFLPHTITFMSKNNLPNTGKNNTRVLDCIVECTDTSTT